jgi:two-component sensor histidine kinase
MQELFDKRGLFRHTVVADATTEQRLSDRDCAFALRQTFSDVLKDFPFLLFFPAIILSAVLFNRGSGLVATVLSAVLSAYFFLEPIGSFAIRDPGQFLGWCVFVVIGIAITLIIEAEHLAYRQLDEAHAQLKRAHEATKASEADKAELLVEANHRIMNNPHTAISLLHLQARSAKEPTREDFLTAAERVSVMAKVQRRLVRSEGADWADSRSFIEELCRDLETALISFRPISLDVKAESHPIPLSQAVSIGLIINELLVNALKYAFPDDRDGRVFVTFTRTGDEYCLAVSDNGVGIPAARDSTSSPLSTGLGPAPDPRVCCPAWRSAQDRAALAWNTRSGLFPSVCGLEAGPHPFSYVPTGPGSMKRRWKSAGANSWPSASISTFRTPSSANLRAC